jgi:hypothetical protein
MGPGHEAQEGNVLSREERSYFPVSSATKAVRP